MGMGEDSIRTLTFTTIVVANLSLIATNRSWTESIAATIRRPNRAFWVVMAGALVFLAAAIYVPFLAALFRFGPVPPAALALAVVAGVAGVLWFEVAKLIRHPRRKGTLGRLGGAAEQPRPSRGSPLSGSERHPRAWHQQKIRYPRSAARTGTGAVGDAV